MPQPRRRDREAKIATILQTSDDLFKKQGYAVTTTNQIASEAKVSIGLLYKYFPGGKPHIARKMVENVRDEFMTAELEKASPANASSTLHRMLLRYIDGHRRISHNVAAFEMAALEDPETSEVGRLLYTIGSESMREILVKLTGLKDDGGLRKWGGVIFHMIDAVVHRQVIHGELICTDEELADALTKIILGSLSVIKEDKMQRSGNITTQLKP